MRAVAGSGGIHEIARKKRRSPRDLQSLGRQLLMADRNEEHDLAHHFRADKANPRCVPTCFRARFKERPFPGPNAISKSAGWQLHSLTDGDDLPKLLDPICVVILPIGW